METEYGYIYLSDKEESEVLGWSINKIRKIHKSLIEKGFLEIIEVNGKKIKRMNLTKLRNG